MKTTKFASLIAGHWVQCSVGEALRRLNELARGQTPARKYDIPFLKRRASYALLNRAGVRLVINHQAPAPEELKEVFFNGFLANDRAKTVSAIWLVRDQDINDAKAFLLGRIDLRRAIHRDQGSAIDVSQSQGRAFRFQSSDLHPYVLMATNLSLNGSFDSEARWAALRKNGTAAKVKLTEAEFKLLFGQLAKLHHDTDKRSDRLVTMVEDANTHELMVAAASKINTGWPAE